MDLLKVLKVSGVQLIGTQVFGEYTAPSWMSPVLGSVLAENSPTGQFVRGLVLGRVGSYEDISLVDSIYLQPTNWEMPTLTMHLTRDTDNFGSGFGCGVGSFTPPTYSDIPYYSEPTYSDIPYYSEPICSPQHYSQPSSAAAQFSQRAADMAEGAREMRENGVWESWYKFTTAFATVDV